MAEPIEMTFVTASSDSYGRYLGDEELEKLKSYFQTGQLRYNAVKIISENAADIICQAINKFPILLVITRTDGSKYTNRNFSSCVRDLDYFLRYVAYVTLAGDASIFDERILNSFVETYHALDIPTGDMVKVIQAMKEIVNQFVKGEVCQEIAVYFDDLCVELTTISSQSEIQKYWEPKNYQEWLKKDKLVLQLQKNGIDDQDAFKASSLGFFEAWSRMPSDLKQKVWREREVMAALCEKINFWKDIPGFLSVGVAERMIDGKEKLAGIINFEVPNLPREQYYEKFNIPTSLKVESSINPTEGKQQELIPIVIEWMEPLVKYNSSNLESAITTSEKTSHSISTLQSGDVIVGRNENGRFNKSQKVTLTTLVFSLNTSSGSLVEQVLSVSHGFKAGYEEAYVGETQPYSKIGRIYYSSPRQKELAKKLDVALFRIENNLSKINSHLKWVDSAPELPIPIHRKMPVQMYGGVSKYQTGYIDQCMMIFPGPASSVVPFFTAIISSQPGDSGTLLVSGTHSQNQVPYMNKKYSSITNAMLGMLVEGSTGPNGVVAVFRPMMDILQQLKIRPSNSYFKVS